MAISDCSRQVVWIHTLLGELGYQLAPVPICGDNQGAIFIASNPVTEKRYKHINIQFHYIREVIKKKLIDLYFIDSENNPADMLTKNLGRVKFQKFRAMICQATPPELPMRTRDPLSPTSPTSYSR